MILERSLRVCNVNQNPGIYKRKGERNSRGKYREGSNTTEPLDGHAEKVRYLWSSGSKRLDSLFFFFFYFLQPALDAGCTAWQISQKLCSCTTPGLWILETFSWPVAKRSGGRRIHLHFSWAKFRSPHQLMSFQALCLTRASRQSLSRLHTAGCRGRHKQRGHFLVSNRSSKQIKKRNDKEAL